LLQGSELAVFGDDDRGGIGSAWEELPDEPEEDIREAVGEGFSAAAMFG